MRYILAFFLFNFSISFSSAQIGINASYSQQQANDWFDSISLPVDNEIGPFVSGYAAGIDYWFPLENVRIDFLPELRFSHFETDLANSSDYFYQHDSYEFIWNTNFYVLNLTGDCDCPTWSKQGDTFEKGFFIQLSPGLSYQQNDLKSQSISPLD